MLTYCTANKHPKSHTLEKSRTGCKKGLNRAKISYITYITIKIKLSWTLMGDGNMKM